MKESTCLPYAFLETSISIKSKDLIRLSLLFFAIKINPAQVPNIGNFIEKSLNDLNNFSFSIKLDKVVDSPPGIINPLQNFNWEALFT